jgi:hypothetical protein
MAVFDPEAIKRTLRVVTKEPHQAGTEANLRVAEHIADTWRKNGLKGFNFF